MDSLLDSFKVTHSQTYMIMYYIILASVVAIILGIMWLIYFIRSGFSLKGLFAGMPSLPNIATNSIIFFIAGMIFISILFIFAAKWIPFNPSSFSLYIGYFVNFNPGKLFNNASNEELNSIGKQEYLKRFIFNICPENTVEEGYTTEKIFQCIEAGCIPIYNGIRPVEKGILNQERIFSDITPELIQNATSIQKMDIWDEDALVNIFLIYSVFLKFESS